MKKLLTAHFILTLAFSTMVTLMIGGLFFVQMPVDNANMINIALGFIAGWVSSAVNFYFGDNDKRINTEPKETGEEHD